MKFASNVLIFIILLSKLFNCSDKDVFFLSFFNLFLVLIYSLINSFLSSDDKYLYSYIVSSGITNNLSLKPNLSVSFRNVKASSK